MQVKSDLQGHVFPPCSDMNLRIPGVPVIPDPGNPLPCPHGIPRLHFNLIAFRVLGREERAVEEWMNENLVARFPR